MIKSITKNYRFNSSLNQTVLLFLSFGIFFLAFGILFSVNNASIIDVQIGYGSQCQN